MKLLVVEDDTDLSTVMCQSLRDDGYEVDCCEDGEDAISYVKEYDYDLIILDRMLPSLDGLKVLRQIRSLEFTMPVIFVTAMDGVENRIDGLDAGADDYLAKPFDRKELSARVRALLRRPRQSTPNHLCTYQQVTLDTAGFLLHCNNQELELSRKEAALLEYFLLHPLKTLSRERIITRVWGSEAEVTEGNLDNYIYFLRRRLRSVSSGLVIRTVHGKGYRLETEET